MWRDPIVEDVRAARDAYARKFRYDLKKIARDLNAKTAARTKVEKLQPAKTARKSKRSAA